MRVYTLRSGGTRIGTVVLANSRPRALSSEDVEPLELIAGQIAATLDAADQVAALREQACHDQLTGIGNRTALEHGFRDLESLPEGMRHATLIIDCDHFKLLNDRFGHIAGDSALKALARTLAEHRPEVQVYRYGGDEFVCLLPYGSGIEAIMLANSVRDRANSALEPFGASVTAGLALPREAERPWATLARADEALLEAKRRYRGRVILHQAS